MFVFLKLTGLPNKVISSCICFPTHGLTQFFFMSQKHTPHFSLAFAELMGTNPGYLPKGFLISIPEVLAHPCWFQHQRKS